MCSRRVTSFRQALLLLLAAFALAFTSGLTPIMVARAATSTSTTRNVALHVVQQAAADGATRSLTFLSSGYQSESAFLADVATCVSTLTNSTGGVSADPWPRYIAVFNLYALYEPSAQLGASRPAGHRQSCAFMTDCVARSVDNNLHCAFGSPNPQVLSCDVNLVRAMAAYAPAQDVVVVLVNDAEPSGVGTDGLLYITNEPAFMPFLLVHYLNRAVAGLQEEYSLGIETNHGRQTFAAANCAAAAAASSSNAIAAPSWTYWQNYSNAGLFTSAGADGTSTAFRAELDREGVGCSLANYVAPTHNACLMRNSSIHHMCPVCKEQLSLAFFDAGVSGSALVTPSAARLDLTAGRCPPAGYTYYVAPASTTASTGTTTPPTSVTRHLYLSLGAFAFQNDVHVVWSAADGTVLATDTQTLVVENVSAAWPLPTTVTATVTDNTPNVRPSSRAARAANMTSTTIFNVALWTSAVSCTSATVPTCFTTRATFAGTPAATPASTGLCVVATAASTRAVSAAVKSTTAAAAAASLTALDATVTNPTRDTIPIVISATVCGGVAVIFLAVTTLLFWCCVHRRPREVLNPTRADTVVYASVAAMAPLGVAAAGLTVAVVCSFVPVHYYTGSPVVLTILVMACVMYVSALINFCGVLLRWYVVVLVCGVMTLLLGAGFLATGLLSLVFYLDRGSQAFSNRMSKLWLHLLSSQSGSTYVCETVQASLKCSGFHAGCFMTTSAECPLGCSNNLYYVNSCEVPFMYYVGGVYLPLAIVALVCGAWYVLLGTLDVTYYVRFRQLSRIGHLRRTFRLVQKPPMAPITYQEVKELRRMFAHVATYHMPSLTLVGNNAVRFLETVFAEPLAEAYAQHLRARGPLTFDDLMTQHFPYVVHTTLTVPAPEVLSSPGMSPEAARQQQQQPAVVDMDGYAEVAGALSPEDLHQILHTHAAAQQPSRKGLTTPMPTERVLVETIREAARQTADAPFCRGLSAAELAGLRRAWTALHPPIAGTLTDAELAIFYSWSHAGSAPLTAEGLAQWKTYLDVTRAGDGIGWREFCYPYAQKALNRFAEGFLKENGCVVPAEAVVSRARVADRYGSVECAAIFLPREKVVPLTRVMAHFLSQKSSTTASAKQGNWKALAQRADDIVRTLKDPAV